MESHEHPLLYIPCLKSGHDKHPLNYICIDSDCPEQGLVCSSCMNQPHHRGHQNITLSSFLDEIDNGRYLPSSIQAQDTSNMIKGLKVIATSKISDVSKVFKECLNRLEACLRHYDLLEHQMSSQVVRPPKHFSYDYTMSVQQINANLKSALEYYHNLTSDGPLSMEKRVSELADNSQRVNELLDKLVEQVLQSTSKACTMLSKLHQKNSLTEGVLKFSETLKYSEMYRVEEIGIEKEYSDVEGIALIEHPLEKDLEWTLKVVNAGGWIGMGVINLQVAQKAYFTTLLNGDFIDQLCMIDSNGGPGDYGRKLKRGQPFKFGSGDSIRLYYSNDAQQVRFKKNERQWCVSQITKLHNREDRYYPFVVTKEGRIEICKQVSQ